MHILSPIDAVCIIDGLYDTGEGSEDAYEAAFQTIIDSGLAWTLPGRYGREAQSLIEAGICTDPRV